VRQLICLVKHANDSERLRLTTLVKWASIFPLTAQVLGASWTSTNAIPIRVNMVERVRIE